MRKTKRIPRVLQGESFPAPLDGKACNDQLTSAATVINLSLVELKTMSKGRSDERRLKMTIKSLEAAYRKLIRNIF